MCVCVCVRVRVCVHTGVYGGVYGVWYIQECIERDRIGSDCMRARVVYYARTLCVLPRDVRGRVARAFSREHDDRGRRA